MTGSITTGVIRYMAFIRPSPAPGLNLTSKGSTGKNRRTIKMKLSMRAIGLLGLFWKKRAHFLCEIDEENPVFARFCFKQRSLISTLGMFRVAPGHVSSLDRACFVPQKAMFRASVRHVSQRWKLFPKRRAKHRCDKPLIDKQLQKLVKNLIFAPNIFLV